MQNNQSEVARLTERITKEYEAGKSAMYGTSQGSATHLFVNNKMERMAVSIAELVVVAGEEAAKEVMMGLK